MFDWIKNLIAGKDAGINTLNNVVSSFEKLVTQAEKAQTQIDAEITKTNQQVQDLIGRGVTLYAHSQRAANVAKNIRSLIN
jgi:hypothetical protein